MLRLRPRAKVNIRDIRGAYVFDEMSEMQVTDWAKAALAADKDGVDYILIFTDTTPTEVAVEQARRIRTRMEEMRKK